MTIVERTARLFRRRSPYSVHVHDLLAAIDERERLTWEQSRMATELGKDDPRRVAARTAWCQNERDLVALVRRFDEERR